MDKLPILLLDDSGEFASPVMEAIQARGWVVTLVQQAQEAAGRLEEGLYRLLLIQCNSCEPHLPFIEHLARSGCAPPVLVLVREPQVDEAVTAIRAGAADYLESADVDRILAAAERLATGQGRADADPGSMFANIIGQSEKIKKVFSLVEKICDTDTTILVHGESGTGKELIARALHYQGVRRNAPFVPVNCGAVPGELLESELFGHEKGAFTHAIRTRVGRFELAHGGTVFLDEISEMSPVLQVKILRVLQERQFERVGGTKTIRSDFRVIAATNRNLEEEVNQGTFREDLYYRLNVIPIEAPPLRERTSDIPLLVQHFIGKFNSSKRKAVTGITPEALACLVNYSWPGNVRELENVVERMVILATGDQLFPADLPERIGNAPHASPGGVRVISGEDFVLSEAVADFEKSIILQALNQTSWVKNQAAKLLKVNRTTLLEKMKRHNLISPGSAA